MSVMRPELIMKSIIPVVMAGIIAIYGVVVAVLIAGQLKAAPEYTLYKYDLFFLKKKTNSRKIIDFRHFSGASYILALDWQ